MSNAADHTPAKTLAGFQRFCTAESKGHAFELFMKDLPGKRYWRVAVMSRGKVTYASAYQTDGVMRASASVTDPPGHLLFRCDVIAGKPNASQGFQCKFGAAPTTAAS